MLRRQSESPGKARAMKGKRAMREAKLQIHASEFQSREGGEMGYLAAKLVCNKVCQQRSSPEMMRSTWRL